MFTLRGPFATLGGAVISAALFLLLWQLVSVPILAPVKTTVVAPELMSVRPDTPVEPKRREKPKREPPQPDVIKPSGPSGTDGPVTIVRPEPMTIVRPERAKLVLGVDRDSTPIVRFDAAYPPRALENGIEGWVQVRFTVTAAGTIRDAAIVASEPRGTFDKAALEAIARWRYNPRVENGQPVERVGLQTVIRFQLED